MNYRKPLLIVLLLIVTSSLSAQLQVGLKGGYTLAWKYHPDIQNVEANTINSFNVSGMAYLPLGKRLAIGVEPGWVKRGAANEPGWWTIWPGYTDVRKHYLEAPIMLRFHQPIWKGRMEVFVKGGYGMALLVKQTQFLGPEYFGAVEDDGLIRMTVDPDHKRWDHGLYSGLGVGINAGPGKILLESSLFMGMRNVHSFTASKNRSLNCSIGYSIGL